MSAIDDFLSRNEGYASGYDKGDLATPPSRQIAVVVCMDARLETGRLLGLLEGEAHVIRNAGGIVTDDVIRSLTISQRLLGTREVMVVQHTKCGMLSFQGEVLADAIEKETGQRPGFSFESFSELEPSVRASLAKIHASPFVPHCEVVRGFVYEVETGRLREVD